MMLPADYHMHTPLCRHAAGEPVELAAQAAKLGLSEIGFSDHNPMPEDDFDDWRMRLADLDRYFSGVDQARRQFPALTIRIALEVDYLPEREEWTRELAARHPWDYLIGSVHYVSNSWAIDNPALVSEWKSRDPLSVWTSYAKRLTMAVESGLFDIIGHPDLCKKFRFYPAQDILPIFEPFLRAAAQRSTAIELNTGGLRKDCREIYPSMTLLRRAAELRIPITFGSDAHAPGEVGWEFEKAVIAAREAGYTCWTRFSQRRRESVPLP